MGYKLALPASNLFVGGKNTLESAGTYDYVYNLIYIVHLSTFQTNEFGDIAILKKMDPPPSHLGVR